MNTVYFQTSKGENVVILGKKATNTHTTHKKHQGMLLPFTLTHKKFPGNFIPKHQWHKANIYINTNNNSDVLKCTQTMFMHVQLHELAGNPVLTLNHGQSSFRVLQQN